MLDQRLCLRPVYFVAIYHDVLGVYGGYFIIIMMHRVHDANFLIDC